MRRITGLLTALSIIGGVLLFSNLSAQEASGFHIIVHASNPTASMTRKQISNLFLKKTGKWPSGDKVLPVDLPDDSAVRAEFTRAIHGKSVAAIKGYWAKSVFSGRASPPPIKSSEAEIVAYVENHAGAVGYLAAGSDRGGTKVLRIED